MNGSRFTACFHSLTALFLITDLILIFTLFIWPQQLVAFPEEYRDHTDCFGGPFSLLLLSWQKTKSVSTNEYPFMSSIKHMLQSTPSQIQNLENKRPQAWRTAKPTGREQERWRVLSKSSNWSVSSKFEKVGHKPWEKNAKKILKLSFSASCETKFVL